MRLLVCGGRDFNDRAFLNDALNRVHRKRPITLLIHGDAPGADRLADAWAQEHAVRRAPFPANWAEFGPSAGPERNQRMIDVGKPDGVVAFPGGVGTADMVRRAEAAGIKVWHPRS
jgi:hypothetical protein